MSLIHLSFLKLRKIQLYLLTQYFSAYSVKLIILYLFLWLIDVFKALREITLQIMASIPFPNLPGTALPQNLAQTTLLPRLTIPSDFNPSFSNATTPVMPLFEMLRPQYFPIPLNTHFPFGLCHHLTVHFFLSSSFFFLIFLLYFKTTRPLRVKTISFYLQCLLIIQRRLQGICFMSLYLCSFKCKTMKRSLNILEVKKIMIIQYFLIQENWYCVKMP